MLTVGADPELFLKDQSHGFISAYNTIPGTKKNPFKITKGAVQVDGMALEFNIDPAKSEKDFIFNINKVMSKLEKMIPPNCSACIESYVNFGEEYVNKQPKCAKDLGCKPDFNAYSLRENPIPVEVPGVRTAAGHVHLGWTENREVLDLSHFDDCVLITKELDIMLGIPSVLLDNFSNLRKLMYGEAGSFRPKPYGVEYRVLSNFWLKSDTLKRWVFNQSEKTFENLLSGVCFSERYDSNFVRNIINRGRKDLCLKVIRDLGVSLP